MEQLAAWATTLGPWGLALSAFLAGGVAFVPMPADVVLAALVALEYDPLQMALVATAASVAGAPLMVYTGRSGRALTSGRVDSRRLAVAERWFQRFGPFVLLFSFLPVMGDVLLISAGMLKVRWAAILPAVTVGKGARYLAIALIAAALAG